jgi:hypothetical protein
MRATCADDSALLAAVAAGDRAGFDAWFERFFALAYRTARERGATRSAAERATRSVLIAALASTSPRPCPVAGLLRSLARLEASARMRGPRGAPPP